MLRAGLVGQDDCRRLKNIFRPGLVTRNRQLAILNSIPMNPVLQAGEAFQAIENMNSRGLHLQTVSTAEAAAITYKSWPLKSPMLVWPKSRRKAKSITKTQCGWWPRALAGLNSHPSHPLPHMPFVSVFILSFLNSTHSLWLSNCHSKHELAAEINVMESSLNSRGTCFSLLHKISAY